MATLGYGRTAAGRVGNGVGVNAYALRTSASPWWVPGSRSKTGDTYRLASTQDHGTMEGRPVVREATLEEYRKEPHFASEMVEVPEFTPLYTAPTSTTPGTSGGWPSTSPPA